MTKDTLKQAMRQLFEAHPQMAGSWLNQLPDGTYASKEVQNLFEFYCSAYQAAQPQHVDVEGLAEDIINNLDIDMNTQQAKCVVKMILRQALAAQGGVHIEMPCPKCGEQFKFTTK